MTESHYEMMDEAMGEWDFHRDFIRALTHPKTEWVDKHPMAYAFGAELERTGRYICHRCDNYLQDQPCKGYKAHVQDLIRREIVEEYMQSTCPECHTPIEDRQKVEIINPKIDLWTTEEPLPPDEHSPKNRSEIKTEYRPCECRFEVGEDMIRWDLDRDKLRHDVKQGMVLNYTGPVFK